MPDPLDEKIHALLQQALDRPLSLARRELAERLSREWAAAEQAASDQATRSARTAATEALNVAVRRIRHASSITEIGAALLETAGGYCGRAALMVHQGDSLLGWRAAGFASAFAESWPRFQMPVSSAPALAQAVETRDAVVSLCLPAHLSPALIELLGVSSEQKAYLFPLSLRQRVVAVLYADSPALDGVDAAALELLCGTAEAWIEALSTRPAPQPESGQAPPERLPPPESASADRPKPAGWESLSPAERDLHQDRKSTRLNSSHRL